MAGALERGVHAAGHQRPHGRGDLRRVARDDEVGRPARAGHHLLRRIAVDDHDARCAGRPGGEDRVQADPAGTGHEHGLAGPSAESLPLVARGQLDAQMTSLSSAHFNTLKDGVDVRWIVPMDDQQEIPAGTPVPGYWSHKDVVGSAASPDLAKLKGADVSTPTGGTGVSGLILDNALAEVGLGINDVKLSPPLVGPDALNALANGAVSAAWISAPLEVEAAKNPDLVPIAGYAPGVTGTAVMAGRTLLDRPELAVKFTQVLSEVTTKHLDGDYRKNPETVRLLAAAEEVEASTIENSALLAFDPSFSMEGTEKFADDLQAFALERGELEYEEPLDSADLIDARFTEAAASCAPVAG
ncbi:hypothetical protein GCM10010182_60300 [Actinomadura cremea]|nr:hypothetical protein GCM10010182_60300 [Actinomadura cremea]